MTAAASPPPVALGLTVAAAQLALALSWTVYVVFVPRLAQQAGLPPSAVIVLLMLDQFVFVLADYACGVASDRVLALQARLGPWLVAVTLVSAAAFVSLPVLAPAGSPALFVAVTLLWTVTSSVLRAPPMNLIGRHALRPAQPAMVALAMLGLGLAAAFAPWLALVLKGQDARLPFVVASLGVCAAALALAGAERRAGRHSPGATAARASAAPADPRWPRLLAAALLAALSFQLHASLNAGAQFRRFVPADALVWWLPVFWAAFNLALWPAMKLAPRLGELRFVSAAALVGAIAVLAGAAAPSLGWLAGAQAVAGMRGRRCSPAASWPRSRWATSGAKAASAARCRRASPARPCCGWRWWRAAVRRCCARTAPRGPTRCRRCCGSCRPGCCCRR